MKRKTTLLLLLISIASTSIAQTRFGLSGGLTLASIKASYDDESETSATKTGFTAGAFALAPLSKNISLMPGINYVQKGFTPKDLDEDEINHITLNYLEVPINVLYETSGFYFGAGPAISIGLSGKEKYSVDNGDTETDEIKFGSGDDEVKPVEFSGNILTGYRFKNGLMLSANYNLGFSNLMNDADDGKITNRYFGFRLAYVFRSK